MCIRFLEGTLQYEHRFVEPVTERLLESMNFTMQGMLKSKAEKPWSTPWSTPFHSKVGDFLLVVFFPEDGVHLHPLTIHSYKCGDITAINFLVN